MPRRRSLERILGFERRKERRRFVSLGKIPWWGFVHSAEKSFD